MSEKTFNQVSKRVHQGILPSVFDRIDVTYPTSTSETYTYSVYRADSDSQVVTAIITVNYTDATKDLISSVVKSYNIYE